MKLRRLSTLIALSALAVTGVVSAQTTPQATPETPPEPTLAPVTEFEGADWVEAGGIRFLLSGWVANGISDSQVEAVPLSPDSLYSDSIPAHTRIDFIDYLPDDAPEITHDFLAPPVIRIFNIADFAEYDTGDGSGYNANLGLLIGILDGTIRRTPETVMPHLPLVNAAQVFYAREQVVKFEGGRGLIYLTAFAQDVYPMLEGEIQLVFQGVTDDGMTYISAVLPLDTSLLPDELGEDFHYDSFAAGFEAYVAETREALEALPDDAFAPHLDALTALFSSIQIIE